MANFGKRAQKMRKPAVASRDERCPTTRGTSSGASPGRSCLKTCNNTERMQVQGRALPRREIRCVSYRTGLSQNVITIQDVCRRRGGVAPPAGKYAAFRSGRAAQRRPYERAGDREIAPTGWRATHRRYGDAGDREIAPTERTGGATPPLRTRGRSGDRPYGRGGRRNAAPTGGWGRCRGERRKQSGCRSAVAPPAGYNETQYPYSLLPTPYSLLPTPYSLLPTPYSLLPTPCSLLPAPYSLLPQVASTILNAAARLSRFITASPTPSAGTASLNSASAPSASA